MSLAKIRVVLADEYPVVLTGLRTLLAAAADVEVVAETSHSQDLAALVERAAPDVLVVDAGMGQAANIGHSLAARTRILVLSGSADATLETGWPTTAVAFLSKDAAVKTILDGVRRVARGETGRLSADGGAPRVILTPRELEVLQLVVTGRTNHEIAAALGVSDKAVEKHMGMLFDKLAVTSRVEAAVAAVQHGFV